MSVWRQPQTSITIAWPTTYNRGILLQLVSQPLLSAQIRQQTQWRHQLASTSPPLSKPQASSQRSTNPIRQRAQPPQAQWQRSRQQTVAASKHHRSRQRLMARLRAQKVPGRRREATERARVEREVRAKAAAAAVISATFRTSPALAAKCRVESQGVLRAHTLPCFMCQFTADDRCLTWACSDVVLIAAENR
jgi:hypothetical protein